MERYWLFNENWKYSRLPLLGWLPAIRLHRISQSDPDAAFHDHPWDNISILIDGLYVEILPEKQRQNPRLDWKLYRKAILRRPWKPVFRKAWHRHRIVIPQGQPPAWSIFIMFRWKRDWGFYPEDTDGQWMFWRDYIGKKQEGKPHD